MPSSRQARRYCFQPFVLYELHYEVAKSARAAQNLALLENFFEAPVSIIAFEAADAGEAGSIRAAEQETQSAPMTC